MTKPNFSSTDKSGRNDPAHAGFSVLAEPIAALATAQGAAAIAIIRISGEGCLEIVDSLLQRRGPAIARNMSLARFVIGEEVIDELMVVEFHGPHSFTGQDSVELNCHGGPYIVQRILQALYEAGCRPAEPGEFTRRAFLNGKMDLSSAEGIKELVEASTHQQWMAARQLATGRFSNMIEDLRDKIIGALAFLAARIDFPDEGDTKDVALETVISKVRQVMQRLERLETSYDSGRVAAQGLRVAILGQPNMGKSTLMNSLLGHERAIVSDVAGTTRDYLEEPCRIRGRLIRLVDTAGVRKTDDKVEKIGVERALQQAEEADLVLALISADASASDFRELDSLLARIGSEKFLKVQTKSDLSPGEAREGYLSTSCVEAGGISALEEEMVKRVDGYLGKLKEESFVSSARHLAAIQFAKADLQNFFDGAKAGAYDEMLAFELQNAARSLGTILGSVEVEDILDKVFSEFCVGK